MDVDASPMHEFARDLIRNGVAVIKLFNSSEVEAYRRKYTNMFRSVPELVHPVFEWANDTKDNSTFVMGGFGAFGLASSFHHPAVRAMRMDMSIRTRDYLRTFIKQLPEVVGKKRGLEQLIDRVSVRVTGSSTSAEEWHRDQSPHRPDETPNNVDVVLGGWVNLDDKQSQFFSCHQKTHTLPPGKTGFAAVTKEEAARAKANKTAIEIPPGHWVVFYQNLVHEVNPTKSKLHSLRQYIGFRITTSTRSLFDDCWLDENLQKEYHNTILGQKQTRNWHKWVFVNQGVPPLPSGQYPPMYAKLHRVNHIQKLLDWVPQLKPCMLVADSIPDKTDERRKRRIPTALPVRFAPSLLDAHLPLYPAYSQEEIDLHTPRII